MYVQVTTQTNHLARLWKEALQRSTSTEKKVFGLSVKKCPTHVFLNFGIHFPVLLPLDLEFYGRVITTLIRSFKINLPGVNLVYTTTESTQFRSRPLATAWTCRTPERIALLNEVERSVAEKEGVPILDFALLSFGRWQQQGDNLHFSRHTSGDAVRANKLLHILSSIQFE
mmetsp:Transcript_28537/g.72744  ORF Transcript_28537/g.72744 Transcript_28537/m.72744 type:complete len:171 (-) Transcript_28537:1222-1734(-)